MKRTIAVVLTLLLLAGCSGSGETSMVTKACSIEESGMSLVMEATAESEEATVETITASFTATYASMGISASDLTDDIMEELQTELASTILDSDDMDADYVEITTNGFDDNGYTFIVVFDVELMAEAEGASSEDLSLNSFTTSMEDEGYTCE